jgi:hypothetical protein
MPSDLPAVGGNGGLAVLKPSELQQIQQAIKNRIPFTAEDYQQLRDSTMLSVREAKTIRYRLAAIKTAAILDRINIDADKELWDRELKSRGGVVIPSQVNNGTINNIRVDGPAAQRLAEILDAARSRGFGKDQAGGAAQSEPGSISNGPAGILPGSATGHANGDARANPAEPA